MLRRCLLDLTIIITTYCLLSDTMHHLGHQSHPLAGVTDAEVLTVAVVAARYFQNNQERALAMMKGLRYLTKPLSISRFNRRLHALAPWLELLLSVLGAVFAQGHAFIIDSIPVPLCKRVRAWACRKLDAHDPAAHHYFGHCAAKHWRFYGWRLHLICTPAGVPVAYGLLPAAWHDLTPIFELSVELAHGATLYGDKGYVSGPVRRALRPTLRRRGIHLVAATRKNMRPNTWAERTGLRENRHLIETANAQLVRMGLQELQARTNAGLGIKVWASLVALAVTNLD